MTEEIAEDPLVSQDVQDQENKKRNKRKYAILMGFCGTGYHGMQFNKGVKTIEGELIDALGKIGAIEEFNMDSLSKISFQRCARTDKGVHALGQVVSVKLVLDDPDEFVRKINAVLPPQIRVWDVLRTNDKFNAKLRCSGRIYEYMIPTYCFRPFSPEVDKLFAADISQEAINRMRRGFDSTHEKKVVENEEDKEEIVEEEEKVAEETPKEPRVVEEKPKIPADEMEAIRNYRLPSDRLEKLRSILKQYEGTHNYHNFTVGMPHWNPSSKRVMFSVTCGDPFIQGNTEWTAIRIHGQAFMLHQIRKMVGFAVLMMRCEDRPTTIFKDLSREYRVNIPKAPSLGLFLQEPLFGAYNSQMEVVKTKNQDYQGQAVVFDGCRDEMKQFKEEWIYSKIVADEESGDEFENWMRFLVLHSYEFAYMRRDGVIPEEYKKFATEGIYDKSRQTKRAKQMAGGKFKRSRNEEAPKTEEVAE